MSDSTFIYMCLFIWIASTGAFLYLPWRYFHQKATNRRIPCGLWNAVIMTLLLWPVNVVLLYGVGILLGFEGPERTVVLQISGINGLFMVLNGFAVGIFCRKSHRSASSTSPTPHALRPGTWMQEAPALEWIRWLTSGGLIIGWLLGVGWLVYGFFVLWYGHMAANAPSPLLLIPLFSILILIPYVIFFFGIRISRTPSVTICVSILSGVGMVIGALGQGELGGYPVNFVFTAVVQLFLAWPAFGLAWWFMPRVPPPPS